MNKYIIKTMLIVNICMLTLGAKMESKNNVDTVNEVVVSQKNENDENVKKSVDYNYYEKPNIRRRNESPLDIIVIKKDEFGENVVLEKYNYYFADSAINVEGEEYLDEIKYLIDVDMYFPQITMPNNKNLEYKINETLKIPLLMFGSDENERIAYFDEFKQSRGIRNIDCVYSSYDILFLSEDYLSINYTGQYIWGNGANPICYVATIDLNTGECLLLDQVVDFNSIVSAIGSSEYTLLHGNYTGFGTGYEYSRKVRYVEHLKNRFDESYVEEYGSLKYLQNVFATDGTFLYVYASDDDTLDGYFVLKFWLSDIDCKIDFDKDSAILRNSMKTVDDYY